MEHLERPLSVAELVQWRVGEASPLNIALLGEVEGELSDDELRRGLDALQRRHPLLRVRIEAGRDGASFRTDGVGQLPLQIETGPSDRDEVIEAEVNRPFDFARGPLARVRVVRQAPRRLLLVITLAHVIADGTAALLALPEVLRAAVGEPLLPITDARPIDRRLPPNARGVRGALNAGRVMLDLMRYRGCTRPRLDADVQPHLRRTRVVARELGREETARLIERTRRERTSVHGALCAALCLEVARDAAGDRPVDLRFRSPINLRAELAPPAPEEVGMFASTMFYNAKVTSEDDLWRLARAIRQRFVLSARTGLAASSTFLLPLLFRKAGGLEGTHREFATRWKAATPSTCGLTNVGVTKVPEHVGRLRIHSIRGAIALSALGDLSCLAMTWKDELQLTLLCPEPTFTPAHADALADAVVARVSRAVG